jgi:hypothetical protein
MEESSWYNRRRFLNANKKEVTAEVYLSLDISHPNQGFCELAFESYIDAMRGCSESNYYSRAGKSLQSALNLSPKAYKRDYLDSLPKEKEHIFVQRGIRIGNYLAQRRMRTGSQAT